MRPRRHPIFPAAQVVLAVAGLWLEVCASPSVDIPPVAPSNADTSAENPLQALIERHVLPPEGTAAVPTTVLSPPDRMRTALPQPAVESPADWDESPVRRVATNPPSPAGVSSSSNAAGTAEAGAPARGGSNSLFTFEGKVPVREADETPGARPGPSGGAADATGTDTMLGAVINIVFAVVVIAILAARSRG